MQELLRLLHEHGVRYVIVGGEAVKAPPLTPSAGRPLDRGLAVCQMHISPEVSMNRRTIRPTHRPSATCPAPWAVKQDIGSAQALAAAGSGRRRSPD